MISSPNTTPQCLGDSDLKHAIRELSIWSLLNGEDTNRLAALKAELQRRRNKRRGEEGA